MQGSTFSRVTALLAALAMTTAAQSFKVYPGAAKYTPPDTPENRELLKAIPPGTDYNSYTTNDPFEKVVAFYQAAGKEYVMPGMPKNRKLPSGQELKQTYFIFDGAKDLGTSKSWAQIQRPLIGAMGPNFEPKDVRDVTVINFTQKK